METDTGYEIVSLISDVGAQRKEGSHPAGVIRGGFVELVAELGLEGWTRYEQWRWEEGHPR